LSDLVKSVSSSATETARTQHGARWQADTALALVAIIWGSTFVVVKQALADISTLYFLFLRFALAGVCLALLFAPGFRKMQWREIRRGLTGGAAAGLFLWLGYILQTVGLKYTSAGNSGFLTGLYIVLVPLIGAAIFRRRPGGREIAGILIATIGMVVMTLPSLESSFHMNRGDLLTIACALAFACHLLTVGHYSQRERTEAVALGQIACAAVLSGFALIFEPPRALWSPPVWMALALTAVFATAAAFALQTWAQRYTTATRTALIFALEPVVALVVAVWLGGEALTVYAVAGGALILAGILAVELRSTPN
jgi:drug/metabolite transporter (DMT)-like permease